MKRKPTSERADTGVLEKVLAAGQELHRKVMEMLKQLDPSMAEYTELLDREAKLSAKINQVKNQLGEYEKY